MKEENCTLGDLDIKFNVPVDLEAVNSFTSLTKYYGLYIMNRKPTADYGCLKTTNTNLFLDEGETAVCWSL